MPRIRTIKPEFPQSESIGRLSRDARLLFIQLWTIADDAGRFRASSRALASLLYPFDDDARKLMDRWIEELEKENCVRRFEHEGSTYGEIPNWLKHQKIDRPSPSRLPAFDEASRAIASPRVPLVDGPRTLDLGPRPSFKIIRDEDFERWYEGYPRKVGRGEAQRAFKAAISKTSLEELTAGLDRYKRSKPSDQAWCHPATWLNGERWLDQEVEIDRSRGNGKPIRSDDPAYSFGPQLSEYRAPREPAPKVRPRGGEEGITGRADDSNGH